MGIEVLLDIAVSMVPDRVAVGSGEGGLSFAELRRMAVNGACALTATGGRSVAYVGINGAAFPTAIFASAHAHMPISPLNYRLSDDALNALIDRLDTPTILVDTDLAPRIMNRPRVLTVESWLAAAAALVEPVAPTEMAADDDGVAVVLFTSGTTADPKAVLLRHENLTSYILETVELLAAEEHHAALVAVPPYHVAGVATVLSCVYAGRRVVHLPAFDARAWIELVGKEGISSAMVVPTMLARITEELERDFVELPSLAALAYGGARVSPRVLARAQRALPHSGFTNAYGLTETASTIAVLGPADHRAALSEDKASLARLASVGQAVPGIELQIRNEQGEVLPVGQTGLLFVRGAQVSGEYAGLGSVLDAEGWFPTKDRASLDGEGYLFLDGRSDDTIIRGGENIAPAEVEDVLMSYPGVTDACVVGLEDEEWGQCIAAVVVGPDTLRPDHILEFAKARLRSSRAPNSVAVWSELPYNATGKLLRREVTATLQNSREPRALVPSAST